MKQDAELRITWVRTLRPLCGKLNTTRWKRSPANGDASSAVASTPCTQRTLRDASKASAGAAPHTPTASASLSKLVAVTQSDG